jgi:hypothetical protein
VIKKPIIAVDIDDVLADYSGSLVEFANSRWNAQLTHDALTENLGEVFKIDKDEWLKRFYEFIGSNPYPEMLNIGGADALRTLRLLGERFNVVTMTSRPLEVRETTLKWLDKHFPQVFDDVIFALPYKDGEDPDVWEKRTKADFAVQCGVSYLIDDQPKHANGAAEQGVSALLFGDYGWNREAEIAAGVTRVADWGGVADYFESR